MIKYFTEVHTWRDANSNPYFAARVYNLENREFLRLSFQYGGENRARFGLLKRLGCKDEELRIFCLDNTKRGVKSWGMGGETIGGNEQ